MGHQYRYPIPYEQYSYPQQQQQYQSSMLPASSQQATNICQLCHNQGHYDYNANLQAILWPAHKKLSVKADHTATKTRITVNGHMAIMMTMTIMGNLFSSGGS